ncbi:MAG: VanZ family protein [Betaproteobacteria bacterium]|nr:VanZ family protein [Betaproteobacteria bacterium]
MPLFKTHCFLFILLAAATLACYHQFDRYRQIGPELLTGEWKFRAMENSRIDITEKGLNLFSSDAKTGVSAHQDLAIAKPGAVLLVSADVKCGDVIASKQPWSVARIILAQNDGKQDHWNLPHTAVALTGSHDWKNYRKAFTIAPETQKIQLLAQLNQATGSLQIRNIHVYPVHENEAYQSVRNLILPAWGAYFLLFAGSFLFIDKKNFFIRLLLFSVFISIIAGITLPGDIKNLVLNDVKIQLDSESESFKAAIPWDLSKVWHFCFFFLFGLILLVTLEKRSILQGIVMILLLAGGTELTQLYIEGRTPLVSDFFIDAAGGIAGMVLTGIFISKQNNTPAKNSTVQS